MKNIGDMAVVAKETPPNFNQTEDEKLQMRVYITGGRHRRKACQYAQERAEEWHEACKSLSVSIWTRGDGKPVSFIELLAISIFVNQHTGNVRPITLKDTMYTSVSVCKILCGAGDDGVHIMKEMDVAELVVYLLKPKALGNLGKKQVTRYYQIALRLGQSSRCYEVFMNMCSTCDKLGPVHVGSDTLMRLDESGFCLALACIEMRLRKGQHAAFNKIRKSFYERVTEIYDGVKAAST